MNRLTAAAVTLLSKQGWRLEPPRRYGCHLTRLPIDTCAIDEGFRGDCPHGPKVMTKWDCACWRVMAPADGETV